MRAVVRSAMVVFASLVMMNTTFAQALGEPDRGQPGDAAIQNYLADRADGLEASPDPAYATLDAWQTERAKWHQQYMDMLGLSPQPEKTPLETVVTGTLNGDGYVVEKLHYQSRPQLYVTANLYRPAEVPEGQRLPAVLYVCGHSGMGRNGNKTAFQSHGIWFARHGYVCLIVDTLQLGEIAAMHHGTYNQQRWWWHSRGYTPAGVECWNGIRGIDYLISRPDVDPERIAVTGISGGGAATFWIAAADERVKVAVPVSGMADLQSYVSNRVINGHCDCMFLYNEHRWPWSRIAALIAPRPMLFVNSDQDPIFPMDANDRIINRLERVYSLYGKSDLVDSVVSIGGHAYRQDIREAAYRFINIHLKNDPSPITDSEVDVSQQDGGMGELPIPPEQLRVFASDENLPKDELNTTIDQHFVPVADRPLPADYAKWRKELLTDLERLFATKVGLPKATEKQEKRVVQLETEPHISVTVTRIAESERPTSQRVWLLVTTQHEVPALPDWLAKVRKNGEPVYVLQPRGIGPSRWTQKNPPNYVERSHVLLGDTVDEGRMRDVAAAAKWLASQNQTEVGLAGDAGAGVLAAYAALMHGRDVKIAQLVVHAPPLSHMAAEAPVLLNVLRVCDVPDVLGALAPLPLTIMSADETPALERVRAIYQSAGTEKNVQTQ